MQANAQKVNQAIGWNFMVGTFTGKPALLSSVFNFVQQSEQKINVKSFGNTSGIQIYYADPSQFTFGAQFTSCYWPLSKNDFGDVSIHQYTQLASFGHVVLNKKLFVLSIDGIIGRSGFTTDVSNSRIKLPEGGTFVIEGVQTFTARSSTIGASLQLHKYFFSPLKEKNKESIGSGLDTGIKAGWLATFPDEYSVSHNTGLFYLTVTVGGCYLKTL